MNRKLIGVVLVAVLLVSALLAGCGSKEAGPQEGEPQGERKYKAVLLLAGNLGDMSFLDSARLGNQSNRDGYRPL